VVFRRVLGWRRCVAVMETVRPRPLIVDFVSTWLDVVVGEGLVVIC